MNICKYYSAFWRPFIFYKKEIKYEKDFAISYDYKFYD